MGSLGPIEIFLLLVFALVPIVFFWRICTRAGYSGAMSLLYLVPFFGVFVLLGILAFGEWPIHREVRTDDFPFTVD